MRECHQHNDGALDHQRGEWLVNLQQVEVLSDRHQEAPETSAPTVDVMETLLRRLPADLDSEQHQQVSELLHRYQDIFPTSAYDTGHTSLVEHEINTGDHRPVRQSLRRHPIAHLDIIDKQVEEKMVRHDLVEPAASPRAANVPVRLASCAEFI